MAINFQHIQTQLSSPTIADDFQNYVYQNCSNPQKVKIFNSVTGRFELRDDMPCGRCWHCTQNKQAEWVTRFFLHNEDWKYRYFITLSYRPIYSLTEFEDIALAKEFDETLPLWDNHNKTHRYALHPCLLSRNHLRNYFKRLRKLVDTPISMYSVGEYGKRYSRPHYHLLVWSKSPITKEQFCDAWSKKYCKHEGIIKPYRGQKCDLVKSISFGDVDFCDLNKPKFRSQHGSTMSDVFKYVSKYVCKYTNYVTEQEKNEQKDKNATENTKNAEIRTNYLRVSKVLRNFAPQILKYRYYYEKKCTKSFNSNIETFDAISEPAHAYSSYQFVRTFSPFGVCSCKNAIAKDFLLRNLESLAQGRFCPPSCDNKNFRYPSYYRRKIAEHKAPIFVAHAKPSLRVGRNEYSFCRSNYCNLAGAFSRAALQSSLASRMQLDQSIRKNAFFQSRKGGKSAYYTDCLLYNVKTKTYYKYDDLLNHFEAFTLNRGEFVPRGTIAFEDVCNLVQNGFAFLREQYEKTNYLRQIECEAKTRCKNALGKEFDRLWLNACDQLDYNLYLHQKLYYSKRKQYTTDYD